MSVSVAAFDPAAVGANVTVTVRLPPAGTVRVAAEAVNAASLDEMADTIRGALPVLETVSVRFSDCCTSTSPKASGEGDMAIAGTGTTVPLPVSDTVKGLSSGSSLVIVNVTVLSPTAVGLNVTVTGWLPLGATVNEAMEAVKTGSEVVMFVT